MNPEWLEVASESPERTEAVAETLAGLAAGGDLVTVEGELGAGKTCFARGLAAGLGIDPAEVSSPSFVLLQHYGPAAPRGLLLAHLDAYRVEGPAQLAGVGLEEILGDPGVVVLVEWASRIEAALPGPRIEVRLLPAAGAVGPAAATQRRIRLRDLRGDLRQAQRLREAMAAIHAATPMSEEHRCPTCGSGLGDGESESPPFCSTRCRLADLGRWFRGEHRIVRPLDESESAAE
jgi:tRNA threonylcarbamoyladenosine biosynthesis protein TsaE